jgi:hypothetical protein
MRDSFRYSDKEWKAIEACLQTVTPEFNAFLREALRRMVQQHLETLEYCDPGSPHVISATADLKKLAAHLRGALQMLARLRRSDTDAIPLLAHALAPEPHGELIAWQKATAALAKRAEEDLAPPKPANRSRGDAVDKLIGELLQFWADLGGHVGGGAKSRSTRFVIAAAGKVFAKTAPAVRLPRAIVGYVSANRKQYV